MKNSQKARESSTGTICMLFLLCLLLPALMGGCGEFGNDLVNATDAFTRSMMNAILDLFFNQFRSGGVS